MPEEYSKRNLCGTSAYVSIRMEAYLNMILWRCKGKINPAEK